MRRLGKWTELELPGVADGEPSACSLSKSVSGQVIAVVIQTTASVISVAHFEAGERRRSIGFADGTWVCVEGEPQPWEARIFSQEELEAAKEVGEPDDDAELEAVFARKTLTAGQSLPWPREWETFFSAIDVTQAEWEAARNSPVLARVEGSRTSKLTHMARFTLLAGVSSLVGLWLTRDGGFAGLAVALLLVALGAGYLRRMSVGRWFL